jgi:hypothetical protein
MDEAAIAGVDRDVAYPAALLEEHQITDGEMAS